MQSSEPTLTTPISLPASFHRHMTHLACRSALQASAISRILKLLVLLAKIHLWFAFVSRKPKRSRLILMDSMMASIMRSAEETASPL